MIRYQGRRMTIQIIPLLCVRNFRPESWIGQAIVNPNPTLLIFALIYYCQRIWARTRKGLSYYFSIAIHVKNTVVFELNVELDTFSLRNSDEQRTFPQKFLVSQMIQLKCVIEDKCQEQVICYIRQFCRHLIRFEMLWKRLKTI